MTTNKPKVQQYSPIAHGGTSTASSAWPVAAAVAAGVPGVILPGAPCPTCGAKGFNKSRLGPDCCTFCDGTEGGNPPEEDRYAG